MSVAYGGVIANVDEASDVCPISADPCVVTDTIEIVDGSLLDFGARRVEVRGDGVLDVGVGFPTIVCGSFLADSPGHSIVNVREPGVNDTGSLRIFAAGACVGDPSRLCSLARDCDLGACEGRSCTENRNIGCGSDADCVSTCVDGNCATGENCVVDGDCDFGICLGSCHFEGLACTDDAACELGACVGDPRGIDLNARIVARSKRYNGRIDLWAAGDLTIRDSIDMSADDANDAGELDLESGRNLSVEAPIVAVGGAHGFGGEMVTDSDGDTAVTAPILVNGGEFDGGRVDLLSVGNMVIAADVTANGVAYGGWGGDIYFTADGDLTIADGLRLSANGSTGYLSNGDGGTLNITVGGNAYVGKSRYMLRGARNYGGGGAVFIDSDLDTTIDGRWNVGARGRFGGLFDVHAKRDLTITSGTLLMMRSGGFVEIESDRDMFFDGYLRETHISEDSATLDVDAGRAMSIGARIDIIGPDVRGYARFSSACSIDLLPTANIRTFTPLLNSFRARAFTAAAGSHVESPADAAFVITTPSGSPPVLDGTFEPEPVLSTGTFFGTCP